MTRTTGRNPIGIGIGIIGRTQTASSGYQWTELDGYTYSTEYASSGSSMDPPSIAELYAAIVF